MEKIPPEIQAYIFKDYYGQRCISKNLNHYNYHHYLDYFDNTPISKNEVERYFQDKPDYMIIFNENLFYIYEKLDKYIVYAWEFFIRNEDDLSKIQISIEILEPNIQEHQHLDLSTTFHILSKRLGSERKRITDYVLKLYNKHIYDIKINNIDDYQLLCKMIHYTYLNIEMLSCDQSIDYDLDLEEIMFYKGQIENREEIEDQHRYHLKCRELLLYKIKQFLF